MKVIYMEQTLQLIASISGFEEVNKLVSTGTIKQIESATYLIIQ